MFAFKCIKKFDLDHFLPCQFGYTKKIKNGGQKPRGIDSSTDPAVQSMYSMDDGEVHRERIYTEDNAKVVTSTELLQFLAMIAIF